MDVKMKTFECKSRTKSGKLLQYIKSEGALYVMLLLPITYYLLFHYVPMYGITIAFKDYNPFLGILESEWVGLDVFKEIFRMKEFSQAVRNTLVLNLLNVILGFPVPIILTSVMLHRTTRI